MTDWREEERARQSLASQLHESASRDLVASPRLYGSVPTDGPVDDMLTARTRSPVPSVRISRAAGRLAVTACLVEMSRRSDGRLRWKKSSLTDAARRLAAIAPDLVPLDLAALSSDLARLRRAATALEPLDDAELVRVAGRAYELGMSLIWVFGDSSSGPRRLWDPWRAKQKGCFFTPRFIAEYMAQRALEADDDAILDPAAGAGALLLEAFLMLRGRYGPDAAYERLHGVDAAADLVALTAISLAFLAGAWHDDLPDSVNRRFVCGDSLLALVDGPDSWSHWFPEIMHAGGFSSILMNPPYGQLKVNQSTLPARALDDATARKARKEALGLARDNTAAVAAALRAHPDYEFAHGGVPDLPRFFIERAMSLLRPGGVKASIVPSTFLGDHRSASLRRFLLERNRVTEINMIPEGARLFVGVNQPTCVMIVEVGAGSDLIAIRRSVEGGGAFRKRPDFELSANLIATVDPIERRIPDCSKRAARLLARMHCHPRLGDYPWVQNLRGELDLTLHREFLRHSDGLPLVRGDQIERYQSGLPTDKEAWASPAFLAEGISQRKLEHLNRPRIVGRQCSYLRKPRRLSFVLIPAGRVVGNSCNYVSVDAAASPLSERDSLLYLLAVLNSDWIEWRFQLTSSTNHVGNYEIATLPLPAPTNSRLTRKIVRLADRLSGNPHDADIDAALETEISELFGLPTTGPL